MLPSLQTLVTHLGFHTDVYSLLIIFSLTFARVAGAITQLPFLGAPSVPGQAKAGLSVLIASILLPALVGNGTHTDITSGMFMALLVKELMIGLTLGIVAQLVFYAIQMSGVIIDTHRGMNQITYLALQLQGHTPAR